MEKKRNYNAQYKTNIKAQTTRTHIHKLKISLRTLLCNSIFSDLVFFFFRFIVRFISNPFDVIVINLSNVCSHIHRQFQYTHICSCLSYLTSHIACINSFFFLSFSSFHLFVKFVGCSTIFTLAVFLLTSVLNFIFFSSRVFRYIVCILFRLATTTTTKKLHIFLRSFFLQINFKVCRADLFSMFIFPLLFSDSLFLRLLFYFMYISIFVSLPLSGFFGVVR